MLPLYLSNWVTLVAGSVNETGLVSTAIVGVTAASAGPAPDVLLGWFQE